MSKKKQERVSRGIRRIRNKKIIFYIDDLEFEVKCNREFYTNNVVEMPNFYQRQSFTLFVIFEMMDDVEKMLKQ